MCIMCLCTRNIGIYLTFNLFLTQLLPRLLFLLDGIIIFFTVSSPFSSRPVARRIVLRQFSRKLAMFQDTYTSRYSLLYEYDLIPRKKFIPNNLRLRNAITRVLYFWILCFRVAVFFWREKVVGRRCYSFADFSFDFEWMNSSIDPQGWSRLHRRCEEGSVLRNIL